MNDPLLSKLNWVTRFVIWAAIVINMIRAIAGYQVNGLNNVETLGSLILSFTLVAALFFHETNNKRHARWQVDHEKRLGEMDKHFKAQSHYFDYIRHRDDFIKWMKNK